MKRSMHIYGQGAWHDSVGIVGTRETLEYLKETIEQALGREDGTGYLPGQAVFTTDGEGYDVRVIILPEEAMNKMALPYQGVDYAEDKRTHVMRWEQKWVEIVGND